MSSIRDELPWRQEERLKLAVSSGNVGLWDWNLRTDQVYFSPEWKQQIGYEDHEIQDSYEEWETRLHQEDREAVLSKLNSFIADPGPDYSVEFRLRHKNGSYRWILACASVVRDSDGKSERMLGSHIDITERKRMEQSLRASEQKYRVLIETMTEGVGVRDRDGRLVYANDALCDLCGYSREEIIGRPPSIFQCKDEPETGQGGKGQAAG
jgi:PAS domain S-box-containing protein